MKKEIIEGLQEDCIFLVPEKLKDDYERLLIEYSENKAILFQKVTTISLYYEEMLKKHQYYALHKIASVDKIKIIYQLIKENKYKNISVDHLKDALDMIKLMIDDRISSLPDLSTLPSFSKEKIEECYDLYCKYMNYLKENNLYDHNYDLPLSDTKKIYVAGFDKLTKNEQAFLNQFDVVYLYLDEGKHEGKIYKFINKNMEIRHVLHDIVLKVNHGVRLQDIMVYAPSDYFPLFKAEAQKYHIPVNGTVEQTDSILRTIQLIYKYLLSHDPNTLLEIMYLTNKKEIVWDYDRRLKTGILNHIYLEKILDGIPLEATMKDFSNEMIDLLKNFHFNQDERYGMISNYIASFDLDSIMNRIDYLSLIMDHYPVYSEQFKSLQAISLQMTSLAPARAYTYILGCNEEVFPLVSKDKGLLLNEEKTILGMDTLIDEVENEKKVIDSMIYSSQYLELSYPISNHSGDPLLESTYLKEMAKKYNMKEGKAEYHEIASLEAERDLLMHNSDPSMNDVSFLTKEYITNSNQPDKVKVNKDRDLSVSEIEVYNGCPFKYYMTYDLKIRKWKNRNMQLNDYGTLRHDICEKCSPYINGEDQDIDSIIHEMCEDKKEQSENTAIQKYYIDQIEKQMKLTVRVLRYQNSAGEFKITGHEVDVREEHPNYSIHGRFDRKDTYNGYARIIDYKSSNKQLDAALARLGFNIQMLLYLSMLDEKMAGVLYFNMSNRIIKKAELNKVTKEDFYKEYQMNGLIIENEAVIDAMNTEHISNILPFNFKKDGSIRKTKNVISDEDMDELLDDIHAQIERIVQGIFEEGNIRIEPAVNANQVINHIVNPCTFCDFGNICLIDQYYQSGREIIPDKEEEE